jgi:hypothetical protein
MISGKVGFKFEGSNLWFRRNFGEPVYLAKAKINLHSQWKS